MEKDILYSVVLSDDFNVIIQRLVYALKESRQAQQE